MATRIPVPDILKQAIMLSITPLDDPAETTIITVRHTPVGQPAYMQSYAMTRAGVVTPIGRDDPLGKADTGGMRRYRDGTARLFVTEADAVPNSGGATDGVTYYDFPGVFSVQAPIVGPSGPPGPRGLTGPAGPQGIPGAAGGVTQAAFDALKAKVDKHLKD